MKSKVVVQWSVGSGANPPNRIEVVDFVLVSPPVRNLDAYALLQKVYEAGITIVKWADYPDGSVEVTVRFSFCPEAPKAARPTRGEEQPKAERIFTGLIVDVRGLNAKVSMYPRILTEGGQAVYDVATPHPSVILEEGAVDLRRLGLCRH